MPKMPFLIKSLAWAVSCLIFTATLLGLYAWRVHQYPFKRTDLRFEGDWPLRGDDVLGYAGISNGDTHMRKLGLGLDYHIFTDSAGARVNGKGQQKPIDADVLTVGDSCSYGYGLDNESTYSEQIQQLTQLTVANLSQVGYSSLQSLLTLEQQIQRGMRPKIVIYGYIEDHLRRNLSPCAPSGAPYCLPAPHLDLHEPTPKRVPPNMAYFTPEQNWRYYREILTSDRPGLADLIWRMRIDLFNIRTSSELQPNVSPEQQAAGLQFILSEMADRCQSIGATLIILYMPYFNQDPLQGPSPALRAALDPRMLLLDLTPAAEQAPKGSLGIPGDGHPNQAAHALMAQELVRLFAEQNWLAPKPPS